MVGISLVDLFLMFRAYSKLESQWDRIRVLNQLGMIEQARIIMNNKPYLRW